MPKLEAYHKKLDYSYALGVFPALNLLESRPERARRLLLSPQGLGNEGVERLRERCRALGIREEMAERVLMREAHKQNVFAALVFEKFQDQLRDEGPHVVLCQISDGGNLGTALRACLGFGIKDVAVVKPAVDAFEPKVIRASMGAAFRLRLHVYEHFDEYRAQFPARNLYPFMLDGAVELEQAVAQKKQPFTLIFGNEASGLPPEFARMGQSVLIPQTNEVDSLNLSVSVGIGVYSFMREVPKR